MVFALVAPLEGEEREQLEAQLSRLPGETAAAARAAQLLGQVAA